MEIQELWTELDERHLTDFGRDLAMEDLVGALFAVGGASEEERALGRAQLAAWGARIAEDLPSLAARGQAASLGRLLAGELGFRLAEPRGPESARLQSVLALRRGLPSLLGAVYREVAAEAGLTAQVVSLPGRLLVRLGNEVPSLIDPADGKVLDEGALRSLLHALKGPTFDASALRGARAEETVGRVLKYLVNHHAAAGELVELYRALAFAAVLRPERPMVRLQQAAVAEQLGAVAVAQDAYRAIAHDFPNTQESVIAATRLRAGLAPVFYQ